MPEPSRPEPDPPLADRLRARMPDWTRPAWPRLEQPGLVGIVAAVSIGAVLLVAGSVWGWRAWSQRSAPPIDDLLPVLVAGDQPGGPVDAAGGADGVDEPGDGGTTGDPAAVPSATREGIPPEPAVSPVGGQVADRASVEPVLAPEQPTPGRLVVHVSGAVLVPGVVEVPIGARVHEAVAAAGGVAADADLDRLNLAAPLVDGERIHVPAVGEGDPPELIGPDRPPPVASSPAGRGAGQVAPTAEPLFVDLNAATSGELEQLPGVGPTIAASIIALRDARGPYAGVDELLLVDGIGPVKLEAIRPFVWVRDG